MFDVPSQKIKLIKEKVDTRASVCISEVNFLWELADGAREKYPLSMLTGVCIKDGAY